MAIKERRFYVYLHRRKDDNTVFYVGKGTGNRHTTISGRSKAWKDVVEASSGFYSEIYKESLTSEEACELENKLISNQTLGWALVNKHQFEPINYNKDWSDIFEYNESSKSCLLWKSSKYKKRNGRDVGSYHQCGSTGYWNVNVDNRLHKIHRIIWTMFYGVIPDGYVVNHKNNVSSDNRIANLELCTYQENAARSKVTKQKELNPETYIKETIHLSRTGGIVRYYKNFSVNIARNGVRVSKKFPILKYGRDEAYSLALEYVNTILEHGKERAEKLQSIYCYLNDSTFLSIGKDKPLKDGTVPTVVRVRLSSKVLNGNKPINKQFTESHYGCLENTLTAARNLRDNILKEYHGDNTTTTCA